MQVAFEAVNTLKLKKKQQRHFLSVYLFRDHHFWRSYSDPTKRLIALKEENYLKFLC